MNREWAERSGPALNDALTTDSIVLLPVGAIEHHGPHLPLFTDLLTADSIGHRVVSAAAASGLDVWILPPLAYTKSDEHDWAPGTASISWFTLMDTVRSIARSVANTPARTLVLYNGHGGNVALLQVALREIRIEFSLRTFLMSVPMPAGDGTNGPDERGLGIHGGHSETSVVMHLRPDLVDLTHVERWVPDRLANLEHIKFSGGYVSFGWRSDDFGPSGVIGDPTSATAIAGGELVDAAVKQGVAALHEIAHFNL